MYSYTAHVILDTYDVLDQSDVTNDFASKTSTIAGVAACVARIEFVLSRSRSGSMSKRRP